MHSDIIFSFPSPRGSPHTKVQVSFEESTYQLRQEKLRQIEALGQEIYPRKFEITQSIPEILEKYDKPAEELDANRVQVSVGGRLMSIRGQGKAGFAHLQQDG